MRAWLGLHVGGKISPLPSQTVTHGHMATWPHGPCSFQSYSTLSFLLAGAFLFVLQVLRLRKEKGLGKNLFSAVMQGKPGSTFSTWGWSEAIVSISWLSSSLLYHFLWPCILSEKLVSFQPSYSFMTGTLSSQGHVCVPVPGLTVSLFLAPNCSGPASESTSKQPFPNCE